MFKFSMSSCGLTAGSMFRKILDAPLPKKGIFFWIFSPVLFLVSFVFAFVAKCRRKNDYASFSSLGVPIPENLHVVCVGNILVGGTGKSPLVRAFAERYLESGAVVAIAARGMNAHPVTVNSLSFDSAQKNKLSDENREHFEILRSQFPNVQFYIFQNKNRRESLLEFISIISNVTSRTPDVTPRLDRRGPRGKFIFILDDGLQHFSCPRHENICVHDAQLHNSAPPYAMPVGPYREGFGSTSIQKLLASFDKIIWTNAPDVTPRLDRGVQEFFAHYKLCFVKFDISENGTFEFHPIENFSLEGVEKSLIVAGIAHPERFYSNLKDISEKFSLSRTCFLGDHGKLTEDVLKEISKSKILFLTLKDFFRFCTNKSFLKLCSTRTVYGCYPKYWLKNEISK